MNQTDCSSQYPSHEYPLLTECPENRGRTSLVRYPGFDGTVIGLHNFGLSAPLKVVAKHFGFEPEHVVAAAREQVVSHAAQK